MATDIRTHPNGTASNADFQGFVTAVHNALTAVGGIVQTADTGQINPATCTNPAAGTSGGYEIWRFNDTLQSGNPVHLRIDYVNRSGTANHGLYVQVGLGGTDGAGNLSGTLKSAQFWCCPGYSVPVSSAYSLRTSAASNRLTIFGGVGAAANTQNGNPAYRSPFGFSVERSHNDDGTDSSDGVFICIHTSDWGQGASYAGPVWDCQYVAYNGTFGAQVGYNVTTGNNAPINRLPMPWYDSGTMVVGLNVGVIPLFMPNYGVKNPSNCLAGYNNGDIGNDIIVTPTEYGGSKTFRTLGGWLQNFDNGGPGQVMTVAAYGRLASACMMRWE